MTSAPFDLSGRCAIVTGASSGLGWRISEVLAGAGVRVYAGARRTERLQRLAAEQKHSGADLEPLELDVTDADSIDRFFSRCTESGDIIDILVNNAGVAVTGSIADQDASDWDRVLDTNLKGSWLMTQRLVRSASHGPRCSIINVASVLGIRGTNQLASYCASKAGLINLTRSLAVELARLDIRVNAVAPGYIRTDMNKDVLDGEFSDKIRKKIPLRDFGRPDDLDGAILYLCSDASRYVTGSTIAIDGGLGAGI